MEKKYKYVHWLIFEDDTVEEAWTNLAEYMKKFECRVIVFYRLSNFLSKVLKLECNQNYENLELDVNSGMDYGLTRLRNKPKNIKEHDKPIEFFIKKYAKAGVI